MAGAASPNTALADRYESFVRLEQDTNDFLDQMPIYTKRDGSAVIFAFNSLFDLSWQLMADSLAEWYGLNDVKPDPRDVIRLAASVDLIDHEEQWLAMMKNRTLSTHDYLGVNHEYYCQVIKDEYIPLMQALDDSIAEQLRRLLPDDR